MRPHSGDMLAVGKVGARPVSSISGIAGLASDSREVKPGYLFAALSGSRVHGAKYLAEASRRGAVAVLGAPPLREQVEALGMRFVADQNPRARLARLAAEFYGAQPETVAAVTGTNGKTSVAVFLRQIWQHQGLNAASMGTIGLVTGQGMRALGHTTPDPIATHRLLAELAKAGVNHLALEASSHGLDQHRLDGVHIRAAAFTNITRDHLDYHNDFRSYLKAKLRLFTDLVEDNGVAVVNADADYAEDFIAAARARDLTLLSVGEAGEALKLSRRAPSAEGQLLDIIYADESHRIDLPLAGQFQAANVLVAAGLAIGLGQPAESVFEALAQLKGAPGRLEKVAQAQSGAPIYVDYAHTPDALETVLKALRPHTTDALSVVFGCGGDRDKGKRPLMGKAAADFADCVIVTDDNPRSEDPNTIRHAILVACPGAREIGDRAAAIHEAIALLREGDCLVIAGKGHETGQIVGSDVRPFCDRDEAIKAARALGGFAAERTRMNALWTSADAETATLGKASRPFGVGGLSIDTRTLKPGDLFVALKGDARDGHDFIKAAFAAKAGAAMVQRAPKDAPASAVFLSVANTQRGLEDLARASRARSRAQIVAVTGSAGKTTTKEMLRLAFGALGRTHASAASYNNHWGVPLSLASMPQDCAFGVFEVGMNHFGEIRALVDLVRPHVALVTTIAPAHLEFFETCDAIADAKSEIFEGIVAGGAALIPADSPYAARLRARAQQAHVSRICNFGRDGHEARLISYDVLDEGMKVSANVLGRNVQFRMQATGLHNATNAVGALLAVGILEGDVLNAAAALSEFKALKGRGARSSIAIGGGAIELIDESYNANPASMTAALANLGAVSAKRRVAVLGDMLELGPEGPMLHAGLKDAIEAARTDLVFLCGAQMAALWENLPQTRKGAYGATSAEIAKAVAASLRDGDVVLIKGSLGSKMAVIVEALKAQAA